MLVTGGAGFVGTHLARRLTALGHEVISLDLKNPQTPVQGVEYVRGDVRDANLLSSLLEGAGVVYHLAATVSIPLCQQDPAESYSNNVNATIGVLEGIRATARRRGESPMPFVFASTAALYGTRGDDGRALTEADVALTHLSYYAAQKHASEQAIQLYTKFHGVPSTVFRFFNIFGPGQDPKSPYSGVITIFNALASAGKPLPLNEGGIQTRDFVSVHDIVQGLVKTLDRPLARWDARPMNLGTGKRITVREIAEIINQAYGSKSEITVAPAREGDVRHSLADITLAKNEIGYAPKHGLADGLAELSTATGMEK